MTIPDAQHPIWPIARVLLVLVVLWLMLTFGYSSSFDGFKDGRTLVIVTATSALVEGVKRLIATKTEVPST